MFSEWERWVRKWLWAVSKCYLTFISKSCSRCKAVMWYCVLKPKFLWNTNWSGIAVGRGPSNNPPSSMIQNRNIAMQMYCSCELSQPDFSPYLCTMAVFVRVLFFVLVRRLHVGPDSSVCIAVRYMMKGSNPGRGEGEIFRNRPDRPRGLSDVLYNEHRIPPYGAEVKERVGLYVCSSSLHIAG